MTAPHGQDAGGDGGDEEATGSEGAKRIGRHHGLANGAGVLMLRYNVCPVR